MKKISRYLKVLWIMMRNAFMVNTLHKTSFVIFFVGKILRFILFFSFIFYALKGTNSLSGYSSDQVIFFYLTFILVSTLSQLMFRNVYSFRPLVVSGSFDLILSKPLNALFRVLFGGVDLMDLITTPIFIGIILWWIGKFDPTLWGVTIYILLILNSLVLSAALHILVVSLGIITLEVDHTIMIYRDMEGMGKFPVDIYKQPLKNVLTFIIPIGIMMTVPAKALMGLATTQIIITSFVVSGVLLFLSLKFWGFALKRYTSASS